MARSYIDSDEDLAWKIAGQIIKFADHVFHLPDCPCTTCIVVRHKLAKDFYDNEVEFRECPLGAVSFAAPKIQKFVDHLLLHHYDANTYGGIMGNAAVYKLLPPVILVCLSRGNSSRKGDTVK
jgi:hypothetical protein